MNFILFIFAEIGVVAAIYGLGHLTFNLLDYFYELRRTLRECREALKRLEEKR